MQNRLSDWCSFAYRDVRKFHKQIDRPMIHAMCQNVHFHMYFAVFFNSPLSSNMCQLWRYTFCEIRLFCIQNSAENASKIGLENEYNLNCNFDQFFIPTWLSNPLILGPKNQWKNTKISTWPPKASPRSSKALGWSPKGGPRRIPRALEAILERFWTTWHRFWDQFVACFRFEHFSKRSKSAFDDLGLILDQMALLSRPIFDLFSISRPLQTSQFSISRLTLHFSQTSDPRAFHFTFWNNWHCFWNEFLICFRYQDLSRRSKLVFHGWQCTFHRRALPPAFFFTICIHKILKCLIKLASISSYATIHNQWNHTSCNLLCGLSSEPHEFTAACNEVADVANKKCLHCRLHCALTKHLLLCHDT